MVCIEAWDDPHGQGHAIRAVVAIESRLVMRFDKGSGSEEQSRFLNAEDFMDAGWIPKGVFSDQQAIICIGSGLIAIDDWSASTGHPLKLLMAPWPPEEDPVRLREELYALQASAAPRQPTETE